MPSSTRMLLILNADDLGASEAVNDETFELMESGLITSATLMANGPAFNQAVKYVKRFPRCSFGVHLNLTEFSPISDASHLGPALRDGKFFKDLRHQNLSRELRIALERELIAQVQRVIDAGMEISHLDSHHFIHSSRKLFLAPSFAKRLNSAKVRGVWAGVEGDRKPGYGYG